MSEDEINLLFAGLTSFEARAPPEAGRVDWPLVAELAERHGLASLLGYQLEYRWPGLLGAPEAIRERLLTSYQGTLGDNVYKLVTLKQLLSGGNIEVIILGAASVADTLFPHVAFRPVPELELLVRRSDVPLALAAFAERNFRPRSMADSTILLSNDRIELELHVSMPSAPGAARLAGLFERKVPALPYGPRAFRLGAEDALLAAAADLARDNFSVPRIRLVELRELALRAADLKRLHAQAADQGLRRALHCALALVAALFPEAAVKVRAQAPELPARTRALLDRLLVGPARDPRRRRAPPGAQLLRRALLR